MRRGASHRYLARAFTGLIGGEDGVDLNAISSDSLRAEDTHIAQVVITGGLSHWQLVDGSDAEDVDAGIVRPLDFNLSTNPKVWKRVSGL